MGQDRIEGALEDEGEYTRLTYPLGDGWSVRVLVDDRRPGSLDVISLEVAPSLPDKVPAGGLSMEILSKVRLSDIRARFLIVAALETARWAHASKIRGVPSVEKLKNELRTEDAGKWLRRTIRSMHPTRRPDADRFEKLVETALRYLEAQKRDRRRVLNEMQAQYERDGRWVSYSSIRESVREAKKEGLLIGMGQGKPGAMPGPALTEWLAQEGREGT